MNFQPSTDYPGLLVVTGAPAVGRVATGAQWLLRPAYRADAEASISLLDLSERQALALSDEDYDAIRQRYGATFPLDYSQGVIWPGAGKKGLEKQARELFQILESVLAYEDEDAG